MRSEQPTDLPWVTVSKWQDEGFELNLCDSKSGAVGCIQPTQANARVVSPSL